MTDLPIRPRQAHQFNCTKPLLVKLDRRGRVVDRKIWRHPGILRRNWFDLLLRCTHIHSPLFRWADMPSAFERVATPPGRQDACAPAHAIGEAKYQMLPQASLTQA